MASHAYSQFALTGLNILGQYNRADGSKVWVRMPLRTGVVALVTHTASSLSHGSDSKAGEGYGEYRLPDALDAMQAAAGTPAATENQFTQAGAGAYARADSALIPGTPQVNAFGVLESPGESWQLVAESACNEVEQRQATSELTVTLKFAPDAGFGGLSGYDGTCTGWTGLIKIAFGYSHSARAETQLGDSADLVRNFRLILSSTTGDVYVYGMPYGCGALHNEACGSALEFGRYRSDGLGYSVDSLTGLTFLNFIDVRGLGVENFDLTLFAQVSANTSANDVAAFDALALRADTSLTAGESIFSPVAATRLTAYATAVIGAHEARPIVTLAGVDISARVGGALRVEIEEGTARLADFDWSPPAGQIDLESIVGAAISIDVEHDSGGAIVSRLFTGRVEVSTIDLVTGLIHITASDGLQSRLAAMSTAEIAALLPDSHWSAFLFSDLATGWSHARDRLSTQPASLDMDAYGVFRITPWAAAAPYRVLTPAHLVDESLAVELVSRGDLVNQVSIAFAYRVSRLALRRAHFAWDAENSLASNHPVGGLSVNPCNQWYRGQTSPDKAMIEEAAAAGGWLVGAIETTSLCTRHPSGSNGDCVFVCAYPQGTVACAISLELRYAQTLTETFSLTLRAPNSIARAGLLPESAQYSGASGFDSAAWETDSAALPLLTLATPTGEASTLYSAGEGGRAEADAAILTALHIARTRILDSHRCRVSGTVPFDPLLDVTQTVALSTPRMVATGKLGKVVHVLDCAAGRFTSEITLRPSSIAPGMGQVAETPIAVPPPPVIPAPDLAGLSLIGYTQYAWDDGGGVDPPNESLDGYICHKPIAGYNGRFQITSPAISAADRDALDLSVSATYDLAIPEDELTLFSV